MIIKQKLTKNFYKEDDDEDDRLRDADKEFLKRKNEAVVMPEVVTKKRPRDPFKDLDPLTQKVDIRTGFNYNCTS